VDEKENIFHFKGLSRVRPIFFLISTLQGQGINSLDKQIKKIKRGDLLSAPLIFKNLFR
jgi:hypothetical protein